MKIIKKCMALMLALVLVIHCTPGIVIGNAESAGTGFEDKSPGDLKCTEITINRQNSWNEFTVSATVQNTGTTAVSGFVYMIQTTAHSNCIVGESSETVAAGASTTITFNSSASKLFMDDNANLTTLEIDVTSVSIYTTEYLSDNEDVTFASASFDGQQYNDSTFSYTLKDTGNHGTFHFVYELKLATIYGEYIQRGIANSANTSVSIPKNAMFGSAKVISFNIARVIDVQYTSAVSGVTFASASFEYQQWNNSTFNYTMNNSAKVSKVQFRMHFLTSDVQEYVYEGVADTSSTSMVIPKDDRQINAVVTEYEIVRVYNSAYDWILPTTATVEGTKATTIIANNSTNKSVSAMHVTIEYVNDATGESESKEYDLAAGTVLAPGESYTFAETMKAEGYRIGTISVTNCKAICNVQNSYTGQQWFYASKAQMYYDNGYKVDLEVTNTSDKYKVTQFDYAISYSLDGSSMYKSGTITKSVDANYAGFTSVYAETISLDGTEGKDFDFTSLSISNIKYEEDLDPSLQHTGISNPTIATSSLDYRKYVTWSRVQFGNYYMTYDETTKDGVLGNINWRVLAVEGDNLLLMADKALVSLPYGTDIGAANWENSAVRSYLNNEFYNTAFSKAEQASIVASTLDNSGAGPQSSGGANTTDNVFILSVAEMNNDAYGLYGGDSSDTTVETRQIEASDYVIATNSKLKKSKTGNYCNYFLRTPGYYQYDVAGVSPSGIMNASGWRTHTKNAAVVPVIRVKADAVQFVDSVSKRVPNGYNTVEAKTVTYKKTKALETDTVKVGDTKTVNNVTYKVTKATDKIKTVSVQSVKKGIKKVTIPSSIKIDGDKYKVSAIKANAFKKAKKTLKTITIKSVNISSINKNAFKGLKKKNTTVKIAKKKYKKYKKMLDSKKIKNVKIKSL